MSKITLIDKAIFLKRTPLFSMLDLDLLLAIADKLQVISYEKDEKVFVMNENAHRMYFIVKGSVEIREKGGVVLATLEDEDFFGDESIFSEKPRAYEAVCTADSVLLALSRTNLLSIISECPSVAVGLLQAYTSKTTFRLRNKTNGS